MNTRNLVYSVLVLDLFLSGASFLIPAQDILIDLDPDTAAGLFILLVISIFFYFVGIVGLFLFKHWGRVCYLISSILSIIALTQITIPWNAFNIFTTIVTLLVFYVIFGEASKEFK